jgi:hypothetical protein
MDLVGTTNIFDGPLGQSYFSQKHKGTTKSMRYQAKRAQRYCMPPRANIWNNYQQYHANYYSFKNWRCGFSNYHRFGFFNNQSICPARAIIFIPRSSYKNRLYFNCYNCFSCDCSRSNRYAPQLSTSYLSSRSLYFNRNGICSYWVKCYKINLLFKYSISI